MILDLITYGAFFLVTALSYGIICLGLNVQWGQTGLFNVGVAGFVAIGAYTSALLTTPDVVERFGGFGLPIWMGWISAALVSGLAAALIGAITLRLRADYLAITTFGIAITIHLVALNATAVTGGPFGIVGYCNGDPAVAARTRIHIMRRLPQMPAAQPLACDAALRLQNGRSYARDPGLLHAQVNAHSFAGSVAAVQGQQQRIGHVVSGGVIHVVVACPQRRAALITSEVGHAAHRVHGARAGACFAPRAGVAEGRAAQGDDARVNLGQAFVVKAETAHRSRPEVVGHNIAMPDQFQEDLLPGGMGHIQTQTLLVTRAEIREVPALIPPFRPGLAVGERPGLAILHVRHTLDADDLGAHVCQKGSAPGQGMHLLQR